MGCLEEWERRNETSFTATMMWSRAERQQKVIDSRWKWFERKSCMSSSLWRWIQRESEPLTKLKIVVIRYTIVGRLMSFQSSWSPETFAAVFHFPPFFSARLRFATSVWLKNFAISRWNEIFTIARWSEAMWIFIAYHAELPRRKSFFPYLFFHRCALPSEKVFLGLFHQ